MPMLAPPEVEVAKVTKNEPPAMGDTLLTVSGYVVPNHPIELAPKIMGRVKWIGVDKGDRVKKGQEIVRIEDTEYQAQVNEARARLASAKAKLAELKAGSRKEEISMALAALHQAQTQFANSETNYKRSAKIIRRGCCIQRKLGQCQHAIRSRQISIGFRQR
jgi:HlyD family secretion protein